MIPCTARPPRPLSMTRPEDLAQVAAFLPLRPTFLPLRPTFLPPPSQPESLMPVFAPRRRSPSPFQAKEQAMAVCRFVPQTR